MFIFVSLAIFPIQTISEFLSKHLSFSLCISRYHPHSLHTFPLQLKFTVRHTNPLTTSLVCWCPAEEDRTSAQKDIPLRVTRTLYHWQEFATIRAASTKPRDKQPPAALGALSADESHHCSSLEVVTEVLAFQTEASLVIFFVAYSSFPSE